MDRNRLLDAEPLGRTRIGQFINGILVQIIFPRPLDPVFLYHYLRGFNALQWYVCARGRRLGAGLVLVIWPIMRTHAR